VYLCLNVKLNRAISRTSWRRKK